MQKINEPALLTEVNTKTVLQPSEPNVAKRFPALSFTRQGVMFLVVNLILLLTAVNYSNHNILIVALFLISLFVVSLAVSVRTLRGVEMSLGEIRPGFQGQPIQIPINLHGKHVNDAVPVEIQVTLDSGQRFAHATNLPAAECHIEPVHLSLPKRGRYNLVNVRITSSFPFGLFRVRRSFAVSQTFWVYATPLGDSNASAGKKNRRGNERGDSVFLRQYRLGDPVRRIHKKSLAMGQNLLVKDIEAQAPESHWLRWDGLANLTTEQRLQVLTRQVLDAERQGRAYGLALPNRKINPAVGEVHKHQCLRMLAEF